jgi:hypothetical protein
MYKPLYNSQPSELASNTLVSIAVTLDDFSSSLLDALRAISRVSRNEMCQLIIRAVMKSGDAKRSFRSFVEKTWPDIQNQQNLKRVTRFNWQKTLDEFLVGYSASVLGASNRSGLFRLLIAWYAVEKEIAEVVKVNRYTLRLKSAEAPMGTQFTGRVLPRLHLRRGLK